MSLQHILSMMYQENTHAEVTIFFNSASLHHYYIYVKYSEIKSVVDFMLAYMCSGGIYQDL